MAERERVRNAQDAANGQAAKETVFGKSKFSRDLTRTELEDTTGYHAESVNRPRTPGPGPAGEEKGVWENGRKDAGTIWKSGIGHPDGD